MIEINNDVATNAAALLGGVGTIIFALQKAIKSWSADRSDIQKMGIDSDLFARMSSEIKRLSETNQAQEKEIDDLRVKCATIGEDFIKFKLEAISKDIVIRDLQHRLEECTNKVAALHQVNISNGGQ